MTSTKLQNWFLTNAWSIIIAIITLVIAFTTVQTKVKANEGRIQTLEEKIDIMVDQSNEMLIRQAVMQKDIEFLIEKLDTHLE